MGNEYKCGRCGSRTFRPTKAYGQGPMWTIAVRLCKDCQRVVSEVERAAVKQVVEREVSTAFRTMVA
jgi:uncharacterized protein with PIN domain